MGIQELLNKAAGELPEGWEIQIHVENGAGWVELWHTIEGEAERDNQSPSCHDDSIEEQVLEAIEIAKNWKPELPEENEKTVIGDNWEERHSRPKGVPPNY